MLKSTEITGTLYQSGGDALIESKLTVNSLEIRDLSNPSGSEFGLTNTVITQTLATGLENVLGDTVITNLDVSDRITVRQSVYINTDEFVNSVVESSAYPLVIGTNVDLSVGSSQVYKFRATLPGNGNSTLQIGVGNALANYSGAVAIMDTSSMGNTAARAPGVSHANPNLYVYRAGASRANDFIRVEHNGDFGRIISGGTSGISRLS